MITAKVIDVQKSDGDTAQVCLRIEQCDDGEVFVKITAWHFDAETTPYIQENQKYEKRRCRKMRMSFTGREYFELCAEYIENFSEAMAQNFVDRFEP